MKKNKLFITAAVAAILAIGIFVYATNNGKYEVEFNSDGGSRVETQTVKKNDKVEKPDDPEKEGYVFVEWQLNNKAYDFSKKVTKNMTLKAKWLPEIYVTVTLDSNGGNEVEPIEVVSGLKLDKDEITNPTREGYTFAGWYVGEKKYDFSKKVTSNLTLTANWVEGENVTVEEPEEEVKEETKTEVKEETKTEVKEESKKEEKKETKEKKSDKKEDTSKSDTKDTTKATTANEFKVGDKVEITGEYAGACDGDGGTYKVAIGWESEIIAVYENTEYPYQVGNKNGTIGFFKTSSLKLRD